MTPGYSQTQIHIQNQRVIIPGSISKICLGSKHLGQDPRYSAVMATSLQCKFTTGRQLPGGWGVSCGL